VGVWAYFHNTQVESCHSVVSILSSHALALEDTARKRAIADRAAVAKVFMCPVTPRKSAHPVPFNDSSEPASLGASYDVNQLSSLEDLRDSQFATDFVVINVSNAEFTQHRKWAGASRFAVTEQGLIRALRFTYAKTELERHVSVPLNSFLLDYRTRASLDDSYWH
jgi:hypothetical protein